VPEVEVDQLRKMEVVEAEVIRFWGAEGEVMLE